MAFNACKACVPNSVAIIRLNFSATMHYANAFLKSALKVKSRSPVQKGTPVVLVNLRLFPES